MPTPPTPQIRLTITVTPEVHETFTHLAEASGMSLGRTMGEWLADTSEAAEYMAQTVARARAAPRLVAREMHAYAMGLTDETGELLERMRQEGRMARLPEDAKRPGRAVPAAPPRPVIRGGKSTQNIVPPGRKGTK